MEQAAGTGRPTEGASAMARWRQRLTVALNAALALLAAWSVVFLGYRAYQRFDLTDSRAFSISETTIRKVRALEKPLRVTVFYGKEHPQRWAWEKINDLLEEFKLHSDKVDVIYHDPQRKPAEAGQLRKEYGISESDFNEGVVVFKYGDKIRYVPDSKIVEKTGAPSPGGPGSEEGKRYFRGEEAFVSTIVSLVEERKPVVMVLAGHGEAGLQDAAEAMGFYTAASVLTRDGFDVKELRFGPGQKSVPAECDLVIVPGPQSALARWETEALAEYARKGGKLFLMPSLQFHSEEAKPLDLNLGRLLDHFGIALGDQLLVDQFGEIVRRDTVQFLPVTSYNTDHPATRALGGGEEKPTFFMSARVVTPTGKNAVPLAFTSPNSIEKGDKSEITDQRRFEDLLRYRRSIFNPEKDRRGPFPIVVAAELPGTVPGRTARCVVAGTHNFAGNLIMSKFPFNPDLFLNLVNWLAERETHLGISSKRPNEVTYLAKPSVMRRVFWLVLVVMPLTALIAGIAVYLKRLK